MTRRLHHAHTANSHDRGSDSFDRGQTGGIADVVVGLDHHLGGQQLVRGKVAIGRPVTAIGFRRGRGCRGFVPADRHPRERDHHDEYEHTAGYQYRRRPARHMCAESPKLALYALVLWRFEEVGTAGQRDESWRQRQCGQAHCENANRAKDSGCCEHTDPCQAQPSHSAQRCDHDERRTRDRRRHPAVRVCQRRRRGNMLPSSFVVTPDQEHREAGSRADNHRNAKSEGKQGYPDEIAVDKDGNDRLGHG
ncbi:Uncharacterised protein [Mycobacterium tuberculosis]|uniref:Uncharacterized protein n=2 Tax=Mycobacterium tuberculosis TaxID=1773 RepID=A0A655ADR8_MYCTX|nr:Uncharacterised protein [Mycobacterium tuberculosis]CKQ85861.1 Uncharacterised protein [Mycobacterium tuberculosis]CKS42253.1 Uncharacterised protein [Mycobacterium tuberculosis]CKS74193.1 Uncharacterised protein [Mycobacterium tuberculosis]